MSRAYCTEGDHFPERIIADAGGELGIEQDNTGEPTGYYSDGVFGITDNEHWESMVDEEPVCAEHADCYVTWDHST